MSKFRHALIALLIAILLALPALAAPQYIASRMRQPFHYISCRWVRDILKSNMVYYETRDDAIQDGHRPCKTCKP